MTGFFIKKTFFDLWDNLITLILINLGFIAILAIPLGIPQLFKTVPAVAYASVVVGSLLFFLYSGAVSCAMREIADYRTFGFREFFGFFGESWKGSLAFGALVTVLGFLCYVSIPFYLSLKSFVGLLGACLIFWSGLVFLLSLQYFLPLYTRLDHKFSKSFKKSFIIFFDNPGFSLFLFLNNLVLIILSVFLALLIPGFAGISLAQNEALKLRLYKYDYLEEHPDANRRKIPWNAVLYDERERVGSRSLKNFFFPWKD